MPVFKKVTKEDAAKLLRKGFTMDAPKTAYEELRLKKSNVSLVLYKSGKLLLQGKEEAVEKIAGQLEKLSIGEETKKESFRKETGWIIGSDEALKGDTFGGLVVAAVRADAKLRTKLKELGVADSKKLKDQEVLRLAEEVKRAVPCEIKSLLPEEYNKKDGNVTDLLNKLHAAARNDLGPGKHIVEQYPGCTTGDVITTKAESKYLEVAAASVLARAAALHQLHYLSSVAGFPIPKGSTHVKIALHELEERNLPPEKFVKLHFNNVKEALQKSKKH